MINIKNASASALALALVAFVIFALFGEHIINFFVNKTQNTNEPRLEKNEVNGATNEQLTKIISELTTALKKADEEREILRKQMEDLRYQGAINREQTKFLTANVYRSGNSSLL